MRTANSSALPSTPLTGRCGRRRQARCPTTHSIPRCSYGWPPACIAISSTSTSFCTARLDEATADAVYQDAKRLGTTLQVREGMWPPDRVAFDDYWKRSLEDLRIDPPVREHLHGVATMAFLPRPLHALAGSFNLFATTGFLAPEFRAMMRLEWAESQQRRFEWLLAALRLADRLIPHQAWILGYRLYLWDMRFRARRGWRIV